MTAERDVGWAALIGATEAEVARRFGEPDSRRQTGDDVWIVVGTPHGQLRLRLRQDRFHDTRVASWTLTFEDRPATLAEAAGLVGLWPEAAPDARAEKIEDPLVRRPIPVPGATKACHSLTATVRDEGFDRISVFDEPPDWF